MPAALVEEAVEPAVRDLDALRGTRGARRVDDVCEVVRGGSTCRRSRAFASKLGFDIFDDHGAALEAGQHIDVGPMAKHQVRRSVPDDEAQPLPWIGRIQSHVGSSRLEDAEQRDDDVGAAFHADSDGRIRAHSRLLKIVCQLVGAALQFTVGQLSLVGEDRLGIAPLRGLHLEQLRNGRARLATGSLIPLAEEHALR